MTALEYSKMRTFLIAVIASLALGGCAITAKQEPPAEAVAAPAPAVLDSDGDGVPDDVDECPDTRPGAEVDARGCEIIGKLENAHFEFDSSKLTTEAQTVLDGIAQKLAGVPEQKFEVAGHADSMGSDDYNIKLGERRAVSVVEYLVRKGVPASRLSVMSYGESQPIADNSTDAGRAMNRRVEVVKNPM